MVLDRHAIITSSKKHDYSCNVRNAVLKYGIGITEDADKYCKDKNYSGYVIHHMHGDSHKKYISNKSIRPAMAYKVVIALSLNDPSNEKLVKRKIKKINSKISDQNKKQHINDYYELQRKVNKEIEDCVLIPKPFHDWLHNVHHFKSGSCVINGIEKDLSERKFYYDLIDEYISDAKKSKEIAGIGFDKSSIKSALHSLYNISRRIPINVNESDVIEILEKADDMIRKLILQKPIMPL